MFFDENKGVMNPSFFKLSDFLWDDCDKFIKKHWKGIKQELGLPLLKADDIELDWQIKPLVCLEQYLQVLYATKEYPQLLILWMSIDEDSVELVRQGKYKLPDSCLVAGPSYSPDFSCKNIITLAAHDSVDVMLAAYEALRERILAPSEKLIHRLVDNPIVWHKNKEF